MGAFWIRLKHNWFRNLLAILQVALAIAAVSAVFVDVVPALRGDPGGEASVFAVRFGARTSVSTMWSGAFLPEDVDYLLEHASAVEAASTFDATFQPVVKVGDERYMLRGMGRVHPSFERLVELDIVAGSFFVAEDGDGSGPGVALVSEELAGFLFGKSDAAIGQTVNVRPDEESSVLRGFAPSEMRAGALGEPGEDVQIIGVFRIPPDGIDIGMATGSNPGMLLPARRTREGEPVRYGTEILVKARPGMERAAEEEINVLLTSRIAERDEGGREIDGVALGIMVDPAGGGSVMRQARLMNALIFGALGLAALVVSSIAMFTTTLANLTPRTRYIGLARALGATRGRVLREVVAESALLAGLGGVVGVAAAFPLRATVLSPLLNVFGDNAVGGMDVLITGLVGVGLAVVVGALAGLYPAWTVARLAPAEAWREGLT